MGRPRFYNISDEIDVQNSLKETVIETIQLLQKKEDKNSFYTALEKDETFPPEFLQVLKKMIFVDGLRQEYKGKLKKRKKVVNVDSDDD